VINNRNGWEKVPHLLIQILGGRDSSTHGRWGGGGLLGCLPPPPGPKKLTLQVCRPRNQNENL